MFTGKRNTTTLHLFPPPPLFPLLFLIATESFPETLFCNQSAHSGSYNYSTSSVQLTAPEQSSTENGTHFYFDNGCWGVQLIVMSGGWGRHAERSGCAHPAARVSLTNPVVTSDLSTRPGSSSAPAEPPRGGPPARLCCFPHPQQRGLGLPMQPAWP